MQKGYTDIFQHELIILEVTHFCNDGWDLYETEWHGTKHHTCFWFGNEYERVSYLIPIGKQTFIAQKLPNFTIYKTALPLGKTQISALHWYKHIMKRSHF